MYTKLIISLALGFVIVGTKADSLDGNSLQNPTLDELNQSTYPQVLIPNARLRVLIDPRHGTLMAPQQSQDELESDRPLPRSVDTAEEQNPNIIKLPDGTLSLALDKRHLKYHSFRRCAEPEHKDCSDTSELSPH